MIIRQSDSDVVMFAYIIKSLSQLLDHFCFCCHLFFFSVFQDSDFLNEESAYLEALKYSPYHKTPVP